MAFIITRDLIADKTEPEGTNLNAKGVIGPSDATDDEIAQLKAGRGLAFRMFDDDGELYYKGRWLEPEGDDWDGEQQFEPLNCFGTPNAGCTYIEYKNTAGKWEML